MSHKGQHVVQTALPTDLFEPLHGVFDAKTWPEDELDSEEGRAIFHLSAVHAARSAAPDNREQQLERIKAAKDERLIMFLAEWLLGTAGSPHLSEHVNKTMPERAHRAVQLFYLLLARLAAQPDGALRVQNYIGRLAAWMYSSRGALRPALGRPADNSTAKSLINLLQQNAPINRVYRNFVAVACDSFVPLQCTAVVEAEVPVGMVAGLLVYERRQYRSPACARKDEAEEAACKLMLLNNPILLQMHPRKDQRFVDEIFAFHQA